MSHQIIKSSTDTHTPIYSVAFNGEQITNATHAFLAAQQALDICKRHNITTYYPTNKLYLLDALLVDDVEATNGEQTS